ncbi:MAG: hypothetical protein KGY61_08235 [Desulfobacterales bacterium]|nr:hypothetical protein [Desulfobacterales bacterium]
MTDRSRYEKKLFFIGALWNWIASLLLLFLYFVNQELLEYYHKIPETMLWYYIFLGAVFVFGLGYYYISKDVQRNRDLIKMGVLAKGIVFLLFLIYLIEGEVRVLLFLGGFVDLIFAVLFAEVLVRMRQA